MGKRERVLPSINRKYQPTSEQWYKVVTETELNVHYITPFTRVEFIDFNKYKIYLKGGEILSFDCLSESQYVFVCNGGFYEEAELISDIDRV